MSTQRPEPLVPGLPDHVATLCLVRVPVDAHPSCKRVSKGWYSVFRSKRRFSTLRKKLNFRDPQLFILAFDQGTGLIHTKALNLTTLSWHTIPISVNLYLGNIYPSSVSIPHEGVVFVFGGCACRSRSSTVNVFLKYEARASGNRWTIIKAMTGVIYYIKSGAIDGKVYVTGLSKELSDGEHGPVEAFDPKEGTWNPVSGYTRTTNDHIAGATVFNGKLLLTYYDDESRTGQIYDPTTHKWEVMADQLTRGLRASSAVEIYGHLFILATEDKSGLRVYDAENDSWDVVEGNVLPKDRSVYSMALFNSWDNKIYIVKGLLDVVVGKVSRITSCRNSTKCRFRVQWEMVVDTPYMNLFALNAQVLIA